MARAHFVKAAQKDNERRVETMTLAQHLRHVRNLGFSRAEIAKASAVSFMTLYRIEKGKVKPHHLTAQAVKTALHNLTKLK